MSELFLSFFLLYTLNFDYNCLLIFSDHTFNSYFRWICSKRKARHHQWIHVSWLLASRFCFELLWNFINADQINHLRLIFIIIYKFMWFVVVVVLKFTSNAYGTLFKLKNYAHIKLIVKAISAIIIFVIL